MSIHVRRFRPSDAESALELLGQFQRADQLDLPSVQSFLSDSGNVLLGCRVDDQLAGFALAYFLQRLNGQRMLFLYEIEVLEPYRRKGLGRAMVEHLKAQAEGKFFVLTEESNTAAIRLYESTDGRRVNPDDVLISFGTADSQPSQS